MPGRGPPRREATTDIRRHQHPREHRHRLSRQEEHLQVARPGGAAELLREPAEGRAAGTGGEGGGHGGRHRLRGGSRRRPAVHGHHRREDEGHGADLSAAHTDLPRHGTRRDRAHGRGRGGPRAAVPRRGGQRPARDEDEGSEDVRHCQRAAEHRHTEEGERGEHVHAEQAELSMGVSHCAERYCELPRRAGAGLPAGRDDDERTGRPRATVCGAGSSPGGREGAASSSSGAAAAGRYAPGPARAGLGHTDGAAADTGAGRVGTAGGGTRARLPRAGDDGGAGRRVVGGGSRRGGHNGRRRRVGARHARGRCRAIVGAIHGGPGPAEGLESSACRRRARRRGARSSFSRQIRGVSRMIWNPFLQRIVVHCGDVLSFVPVACLLLWHAGARPRSASHVQSLSNYYAPTFMALLHL
mmetsp:Transcript_20658/g.49651  ORF Transcript_20658/g.49651 Transcript_20658/m.49651 type:complete len:414 (+) Transcript_20658:533-1774(+)